MDRDELSAWLRLLETPRLGRESARKLLAAFGSPQAVIEASTAARREVVAAKQAAALAVSPENLEALVSATVAWLSAATEPRSVITLGDTAYPASLLTTADPPVLLYAQGRLDLLQTDAIAVVGSRNPTPQGAENARAFSSHLSRGGFTIISGMALGIDAQAHTGGLEAAGSTVAVVGTGLDRVYPPRNLALAHHIANQGLVLSEYALGTPPMAPNFPLRNRIIAGLARGTLVVEAALQSGSLITARLANESGREVFAIPGSIHSPQSRGCHALIKQGAKLVETAQDILEELHPLAPLSVPITLTSALNSHATEDPLLTALGFDPVTLDALIARTGWSASKITTQLLELELQGTVARLSGQLFQRAG
jgi:DNA processing protein